MPFLKTADHVRLFVSDWPGGDPVVLVHAWALNGDMWTYQLPDLLDGGFRCVTFDRRGHGRSDRPGTGYDLDTLADDLDAVIEGLGLSGVTLVGHSMGGAEVVRYVTRHGTRRLARIVLSGTVTPYLNPPEESAAQSRALLRRDIGAWMDANGSATYFNGGPVVHDALDWTRARIAELPLPILIRTQDAFLGLDQRAEVAQIDVPTLVIHGTCDTSMPIEITGRPTAALIPGSRLLEIEGAGHGLYASESARYNRALLDFIAGR